MNDRLRKAMPVASGSTGFGRDDQAQVEELIAARRAALNLMEDAVLAKQRSDELVDRLQGEIAARKVVENELKFARAFAVAHRELPGFCDIHDG